MPILAFHLETLLILLAWVSVAVLAVWVWQKSKSGGNLLFMLGAAAIALVYFFTLIESYSEFIHRWMPLIGAVLILLGYYATVRPIVAERIAAMKAKVHQMTSDKKGGGGTGS
jgi:hypothetical protein